MKMKHECTRTWFLKIYDRTLKAIRPKELLECFIDLVSVKVLVMEFLRIADYWMDVCYFIVVLSPKSARHQTEVTWDVFNQWCETKVFPEIVAEGKRLFLYEIE